MVIKNYKYDYSGGKIYYTIDVDGREFAMEHIKTLKQEMILNYEHTRKRKAMVY